MRALFVWYMLNDFNMLIVAGGEVFVLAPNKRRTCSVFVAIGRHKNLCFRIKPFGRRRCISMSATCRLLCGVLRCVVLVGRVRGMCDFCKKLFLTWKDVGGGAVSFRLINCLGIYYLLSDIVTRINKNATIRSERDQVACSMQAWYFWHIHSVIASGL